jgi:hypothetical protein
MRLREMQAAFRAALLDGDDAAAATILGDGLAPAARLAIYRHHVLTTLTSVLESTYPVVCRLVDRRFFGWVAERYIRRQPPAGPCLFEYGRTFPEFLATLPECRELPYLADVARLEWAMQAALHAEDVAPLDPAGLAGLAAAAVPRLVFRLDPSAAFVASPWPIEAIWRAHQPGADPDARVDLGGGGARLEIRRLGDDVGVRALDAGTYAFRAALAGGRPLGDAARAAADADPAFGLPAALQALLAERLPTGFVLAPLTTEMDA